MLHWAWKPIRQPARSPPDTVVTIAMAGSSDAIRSSKARPSSLTAWGCCHFSRAAVATGGSLHPSGLGGPHGELDPAPGIEPSGAQERLVHRGNTSRRAPP